MKLIIRKYNQEFFTVNAQPTIIRLIVRNGDGGGNSSSGVQSVNAGTNVTITGTTTNPIINATGGGSSYLSYVGYLSQSEPISTTSGLLVIGKSYQIQTLESGDNFTNVGYDGSPLPFIATGTTPTTWTHSTVVTNLTDSAPIATVIKDDIGTSATWIVNQIGDYQIDLDTPVDENKFFIPIIISFGNSGNAANYLPISDGNQIIGYYILEGSGPGDGTITNVSIEFFDESFNHVDMFTLLGAGGRVPIQFFVYP